jgi:hypothetical protein
LEPKPPPTSGAITRTLCSGRPSTKAVISRRSTCGFWLATYSVYSSVARLNWATTQRGSIALGTSRLFVRSIFVTCCALANTAVHRGLVADRPLVAAVVRRDVVQGRRGRGVARVHHGRQHFVVDFHRFGGIARLLERVGHDHGDVVADVAHPALRQHRVRRLLHGRAVGAGDEPAAGQPVDLARQVLPGEDPGDPGHRLGLRRIDAAQVGVGVLGTHEDGVALVRQVDVVGVLAAAGQEAVVLLAADGLADVRQLGEIGCTHGVSPLLDVVLLVLRTWTPSPPGPAGPP